MGQKYALENDRIFPYAKLKSSGYGKKKRVERALAHEVTNRTILTQIANRDKFELHLRNLLDSNLGTTFVSNKLKILFPMINDVEICRINIQPATKPLVLTVKDKNGIQQEKFYVRSGNSSQERSLTEMPSYPAERFQK